MKLQILSILLTIAVIVLGYLYLQARQGATLPAKADPVVAKLGKIMALPENEQAQVTTIENVEAAKQRDATFFATAAVGDRLIAYKQLLVLYDMKAGKIKNIQTFGTKPPPGPTKTLTVALRYNGNEEARAKDLKTQMEAASPNYKIVEVAKSKATYTLDVIYVVNPARREDAITLGQGLGGSPVVGELAPGEAPTDADLIVAFRDIP
ncbi:hypothetical protein HY933_01825 [Candidatus Falkowbacteria bacterium]|nr:hypothetical protein [Candidatus Falkowbacteria bacterium]